MHYNQVYVKLKGEQMMNRQQIEYFLGAVKYLNFTRVADEFYTSQPTISRQIALLEAELGFELFKRDKGNLHLTPGGAIMAQEFAKVNKIIHDAIAQVGRVSEGLEGKLAIGYLYGTNTDMFIHPPTAAFIKLFPKAETSLEAASFAGLRKKLDSGEFDIVFTLSFELPAYQDVLYRRCYTVAPVIAMSSGHPLAGKEDLEIQDFSGETFLVPSRAESDLARMDLIKVLKRLGVNDTSLRNMNNSESVLFGVRSGMGVALLGTSMECIFDSRYSYLALPTDMDDNFIATVWKKDNLNPIIPIYVEIMREILEIEVFKE